MCPPQVPKTLPMRQDQRLVCTGARIDSAVEVRIVSRCCNVRTCAPAQLVRSRSSCKSIAVTASGSLPRTGGSPLALDLFSRYVVAWMISLKENSALATQLMEEAIARYRIEPEHLTLPQDRGSPMITTVV